MATSWSYVANDDVQADLETDPPAGRYRRQGRQPPAQYRPGSRRRTLHRSALQRLKEIGEWMKVNGDAIYATRAIAPYKEGKVCYTRLPDGRDQRDLSR